MAAALLSCGTTDARGLCAQLTARNDCSPDAPQQCESALATEKSSHPTCAPFVDALASCIAKLSVSCTGATSIAARGDGNFDGPRNFTSVGGYDVVVNDSGCDKYRRGLEACRGCPTAAGANEVEKLGIGEKCTNASQCATGLACQKICTKACTDNDDCLARSDECKLKYQFPNVCVAGKCTRSCSGDTSCQSWVDSASTCVSSSCTL
jgi:hypothetical protein